MVLDEHGFLMTVAADPEGYELIAEKHVFESRGTAWFAPVFADGQLYLRTITGEMAALTVD